MNKSFLVPLAMIVLLATGCKKDDPTSASQPVDTISNYVKLGFNYDKINPDAPTFQFLRETGSAYSLSKTNIVRGGSFNMITSFDALFTFVASGNTYRMTVTNIESTGLKYYPGGSYTAAITATFGGRTISGTLIYP